jgi:AhpD family alkylhydroperoxidase
MLLCSGGFVTVGDESGRRNSSAPDDGQARVRMPYTTTVEWPTWPIGSVGRHRGAGEEHAARAVGRGVTERLSHTEGPWCLHTDRIGRGSEFAVKNGRISRIYGISSAHARPGRRGRRTHTNLREGEATMQPRIAPTAFIGADARQALQALGRCVMNAGHSLPLELVCMRASQINGCSACVDMHGRALKKAGEADERIFAIAAWREAAYFTDAERAALALSEAVTRLSDRADPVPDDVWTEPRVTSTNQRWRRWSSPSPPPTSSTVSAWPRGRWPVRPDRRGDSCRSR